MKSLKVYLVIISVFFGVSAVFCQEEIIVINHPDLGLHQRPLVHFNHEEHEGIIECARCHHDYDEYGANQGGEDGQDCSECHGRIPLNPVPLVRALHIQCKNCHSELIAKDQKSGPIMCGQCHVKKRKPLKILE